MSENQPISRNDLAYAHRFMTARPRLSLFYAAVMILASYGSLTGYLRWETPLARGSFALLALGAAGYFLAIYLRRPRT